MTAADGARLKALLELHTELGQSELEQLRALWSDAHWYAKHISAVAIVVMDNFHFGLVRQLSVYAEHAGILVNPFFHTEAALMWLEDVDAVSN